jgi:hypothetical protein
MCLDCIYSSITLRIWGMYMLRTAWCQVGAVDAELSEA